MNVRELWTRLANTLRGIPFLDEALWDWIKARFRGATEGTVTVASETTIPRPNDNVLSARRSIGIIYSSRISAKARRNWQKVVWEDPDFQRFQQATEVALENLLERYEERHGAFPTSKGGGKVTTETGAGAKRRVVTTTPPPQSQSPRAGFSGHQLFVEAVEEAGRSEQSLKAFIHGITHERIFERVGGKLGNVAQVIQQAKPALIGIVILTACYIGLMVILGGIAVSFLMYFISHPTSLFSAVVGFVALAGIALMGAPIANRIFPKGLRS